MGVEVSAMLDKYVLSELPLQLFLINHIDFRREDCNAMIKNYNSLLRIRK